MPIKIMKKGKIKEEIKMSTKNQNMMMMIVKLPGTLLPKKQKDFKKKRINTKLPSKKKKMN